MGGFEKIPILYAGQASPVTHMYFQIYERYILHTRFIGRKTVPLFPFEAQYKLCSKRWQLLSLTDKLYQQWFPAVKLARGYEPGRSRVIPCLCLPGFGIISNT